MLLILLVFIAVYALLLGSLVFLGYYIQQKKEKSIFKLDEERINTNELVVIIPFRNEEERIERLLKSILASKVLPKEFIFVDDHSTDKSVLKIEAALSGIPHRILHLPDGIHGKKYAIRYALEKTESEYILGFDADIDFDPDYFARLNELSKKDLYILPAILKAEKLHEHLYEVDLILVNAANCGISGLKRPIMASGANMLYNRKTFERVDQFERHKHMPSGDDIYLLRDFRDANADIQLITDTDFAIHTETPQSLKEFIHQRLRWIAKTGDVKDYLSTNLAIVQALLTFGFVALMIVLALRNEWNLFAIGFGLKSVIDMLVFLPYFNRIKRMKSWLFIPIYELIFPIYSLVILATMYFYKPIWKGRKLETNF